MANDLKVEVRGLAQLNRALKQVDSETSKELKAEFKKIAESVAVRAASKVPRRTGRAANSIKARSTARGAAIAFGGSKAEYYPWLDFGGRVGRKKSVKRPFMKEGRYIYPTIREEGKEIREAVENTIMKLAKRAGFETN